MIILGITGSIGMGKSTVSNMLQDLGIPVHGADKAVHKLLGAGGASVAKIAKIFPSVIQINADDTPYVDRQSLGEIVFKDEAKKKQLEDILHPLVREASDHFKEKMRAAGHDIIALDIPLLFETGSEHRVDYVIVVTAPADVQRTRVLKRPGMTEDKFNRILKTQFPNDQKVAKADFVIHSDQTLEEMRKEVEAVVAKIRTNPPVKKAQSPKNG